MTSELWAACREQANPVLLDGAVHRLVESQEQVATNALVNTLAEQSLLEALLERSKPSPPPTASGLHYLLLTPFRYPPLRHGSRFGGRHEPSLFYAARRVDTALAEGAYYRFVFWNGMAEPPGEPLNTRHTVFETEIRTERGLRLQDPPFDAHTATIASRTSYQATQALGADLRGAGIEAFEYPSARDTGGGLNVALFTPAALASPKPSSQTEWLCETRAELVSFYSHEHRAVLHFPLQQFVVDGVFPVPAT